ncbi:MAG: class I SAM-dependent methyltransferase [Anaerolineales bacterium]|jgi:2-polyprenyl-3-methyl-5-hydroxy-6-metoxy-1,4-benzoquinol methylase
MPIFADPEGVSAREILNFVDLKGKRLLEIGCGRGRLTIPLAETASHITAIDPSLEDIRAAMERTPERLARTIEYKAMPIEEFDLSPGSQKFDLILFTWSL